MWELGWTDPAQPTLLAILIKPHDNEAVVDPLDPP